MRAACLASALLFCSLASAVASQLSSQQLQQTYELSVISLRQRSKDWSREACELVAANLAPCLTANSPLSSLTSTEEASCCQSVAAFEEAGCFCFAGTEQNWAYEKRLVAVATVHQSCTWEPVLCPEDRIPSLTLYAQSSQYQRDQLNAFTLALSRALDLAQAIASSQKTQVEVSVELTLETTSIPDQQSTLLVPLTPRVQHQVCWLGRIRRAAAEQPILYGCLVASLTALLCLCFVRSRGEEEHMQPAAGIVVAAEEAKSFQKLGF